MNSSTRAISGACLAPWLAALRAAALYLRSTGTRRARVLLVLSVASLPAVADQYHSEVRELDTAPPEAQQQDAKKLLESTTDPYARALLLRDLAGQAVDKKDYDTAAGYLEQALGQNALSGPAPSRCARTSRNCASRAASRPT